MDLEFREAVSLDLSQLVSLLADDELGSKREDPSMPINSRYIDAMKSILADPNNELIVVQKQASIVGMLQLTFIPYLTHIGSWRCLIEGVRIDKKFRGKGYGTCFFQWAIERARIKQCRIVQLTSDKQRPDALRFYESLGFRATHEGFKLDLTSD
jgi:GNAT superfamily N-acetyltransferase